MADEPEPPSNVDRLLKHLKDDSLAALLVRAHSAVESADPTESMKAILTERLERARERIDGGTA